MVGHRWVWRQRAQVHALERAGRQRSAAAHRTHDALTPGERTARDFGTYVDAWGAWWGGCVGRMVGWMRCAVPEQTRRQPERAASPTRARARQTHAPPPHTCAQAVTDSRALTACRRQLAAREAAACCQGALAPPGAHPAPPHLPPRPPSACCCRRRWSVPAGAVRGARWPRPVDGCVALRVRSTADAIATRKRNLSRSCAGQSAARLAQQREGIGCTISWQGGV